MSSWDVFHSERLEVLRGLSEAEVRAAVAAGSLRDDDLARPAGTADPWVRLAELPGLLQGPAPGPVTPLPATSRAFDEARTEPEVDISSAPVVDTGAGSGPEPEPPGDPAPDAGFAPLSDDDLEIAGSRFELTAADEVHPRPEHDPRVADQAPEAPPPEAGAAALSALLGDDDRAMLGPTQAGDGGQTVELDTLATTRTAVSPAQEEPPSYWEWDELEHAEYDPLDEDEDAAAFTLAPSAGRAVEEIDLTAMVDVSFQLILFFLVAASAVYLKTLEIPEPNPERDEAVAVQPRTIEDLESDFIVVEIDPQGTFTVDREPVAASVAALAARLSEARRDTGRTAMLLSANSAAQHRLAVLAYDAANEIGLSIAIARTRVP